MPDWCSFCQSGHTGSTYHGSYHSFPKGEKKEELRESWIKALPFADWKPSETDSLKVCQLHFTDDDFQTALPVMNHGGSYKENAYAMMQFPISGRNFWRLCRFWISRGNWWRTSGEYFLRVTGMLRFSNHQPLTPIRHPVKTWIILEWIERTKTKPEIRSVTVKICYRNTIGVEL